MLQILFLYFGSYTCITEHILVLRILYLRNIYLSYGSYTCVTELVLVFQILYLYYKAYTCLMDLIITDHILVLRILYLYMELIRTYSYSKVPVGTISRNRSKSYQIRTKSDQTYADTNISL